MLLRRLTRNYTQTYTFEVVMTDDKSSEHNLIAVLFLERRHVTFQEIFKVFMKSILHNSINYNIHINNSIYTLCRYLLIANTSVLF